MEPTQELKLVCTKPTVLELLSLQLQTLKKQVPIDIILSAAGWNNMNTFAQLFYSINKAHPLPLKILVKNF